ncbi:MAG: hypothetical protein ABFC73_11390 [Clostridiaceae bacterium]
MMSKTLPTLVYYAHYKNSNGAENGSFFHKTQEQNKNPALLIDIELHKWRKNGRFSAGISYELRALQGKMRLSLHTKNTRIGRKYILIYRFPINMRLLSAAYDGGARRTRTKKIFCKKY